MNNFISCYTCSRPLKSIIFTAYDYNDNKAPYTFYQCAYCELIQIYPFPKDEKNTKYYSYSDPNEYAKDKNEQINFLHRIPFGTIALKKYIDSCYQNRYEKIERLYSQGKILDIGCGEGSFLKKFSTVKWNITGIEINKYLAKSAKKKLTNAKILTSPIESLKLAKEKYDIITLWHVLEHLHNPHTMLRAIHKLLHPKGYLIIEVPHGNSLYRKIFKDKWQLLLLPRHLFFWTRKSLSLSLKQSGFEVIHVSYPGFLSFSGSSSLANFLRSKKVNTYIATLMAILFFPLVLIINILSLKARDNIIIIAQPKSN